MLLAAPLFAQDDQNERLLLPIFTPPVAGAFGSDFHTSVTIANTSDTVLSLSGLEYDCSVILSCPQTPDRIDMAPERVLTSETLIPNGAPGRFVFVPKSDLDRLSMSLRIHDVTREDLNFGTEMPIVRESEFVTGRIVFPLVPVFPWYRNTLRIYAASPVDVLVKAGAQPAVRISLTGAADQFDPAYAVFTNFKGTGLARVTIQTVGNATPVPIWAFITVTNNQTQAITTITTRP